MDAYGYLQIKGRIKDIIIRGGENVYPAEIEKILYTHPKVTEAQVSSRLAVYRMPDDTASRSLREQKMVSSIRWSEWRIFAWVKRSASSSGRGMDRTAPLKKSEITAGRR